MYVYNLLLPVAGLQEMLFIPTQYWLSDIHSLKLQFCKDIVFHMDLGHIVNTDFMQNQIRKWPTQANINIVYAQSNGYHTIVDDYCKYV